MRRLADSTGPGVVGIFLGLLLVFYAGLVWFGLNAHGVGQAIDLPLYTALEVSAALFCLARPLLRPDNRGAWLAVGLAARVVTAAPLHVGGRL